MDALINRYRSTLLLVIVIAAQFVLLAYEVKNESHVRVIRVWAVTAVTPIANVAETIRGTVAGFFSNYVSLRDVRNENRRMRTEIGALKLQTQFLQTELATAERAKALSAFEIRNPSKMIAARMIGAAGGASNNVVFLDRGSSAGVQKGMAVVTPDGIVGQVVGSYPTASQALLVTDPGFAAGVISQRNKVRGVAKGIGGGRCKVDFVQNEEKVDVGELFYTSGDDRVFPKGLPVGRVTVVKTGASVKEIYLDPSGLQSGPEEVLIILQGVHQPIPEEETASAPVYLGAPVPEAAPATPKPAATLVTDADRLRQRYRDIAAAQNHTFGAGPIPNFNLKPLPSGASPPVAKPIAPKPLVPKPAAPKPALAPAVAPPAADDN